VRTPMHHRMQSPGVVRSAGAGRLRAWLPVGDALDAADWSRRHRTITALVWAHAAVVPVFGVLRGQDPRHALAECSIIALAALGASARWLGRTTRSVLATLGLVTSSAILTHFADGLIEMHFHFFVVVAVVALYQSWVPFLIALAFVVLHHGVGGQLAPAAVFNHASATEHAWRWALVHGAFVLAESAACLVAWRLNEVALTNERDARRSMQRAHDELAAAQSMSAIGSWDWDLDSDTVWWSDELFRIVGRDPSTFRPSVSSFLAHLVEEDRPTTATLIAATRSDGTPLDFECRLQRTDGTVRVVHVRSAQDEDGDGSGRHVVGTCHDITDRKALETELQHQAFHDDLTDLPNRALFMDRLAHGLALSRRSTTDLALLYIDIDDFKAVNDGLGHAVGDEVLVVVARRLADAVREADTVARLGGDEFAVILEDTGVEGATEVAEKLRSALDAPFSLHGTALLTRASIGIAVAAPTDTPGDLLRHADMAMYAAKREGGHAHRVFTDSMQESLSARRQLEAELQTAIASSQLVVHYQPLVDLATDEVAGVEALVRWDHPTRGLLPPSDFVAFAEETGLVGALGTWVLRQALQDLRHLQAATGRPLYVSVNVAAPQLREDFVGVVEAALSAAGVAPQHLLLELTETCLVPDDPTIVPILSTLRALGVRIAIDDFGTGYSSLAYLRQLPIDHLKIDRSFVRDITDGPEGSALAHSIIKLGATFNLHVVGEGIETAEQAEVLRRLGCPTGQGYHYQRPTDLDSLVATLTAAGRRTPEAVRS
jgi:diguanylate cyclase (GGDEF)-like protein/PAS domain S-box-containing protein